MKKLVISIKSTTQILAEVESRLKKAQKKRGKVSPHYEISFTDMKQFKKFIGNIDILTSIQHFKPKSIYELSRLMKKDTANVSRLVNFFEEAGAIRIEENMQKGRNVRTPIVDYEKIEFNLAA